MTTQHLLYTMAIEAGAKAIYELDFKIFKYTLPWQRATIPTKKQYRERATYCIQCAVQVMEREKAGKL